MNKIIINKRVYDLDTATVVVHYVAEFSGEFILYKSKNDNFFTFKHGRYFEESREEACTICGHHLSIDKVEQIFGTLEEG